MFSTATQTPLDHDENAVHPKAYVELLKKRRAELEEGLRALGARQNLYSPPNRLPTEVLKKIFMTHARDVYWDWQEDDKLRWVKLMQVCRHWREVVVNCASLWTRIVLAHPEFIMRMLARSKGALLSFEFDSEELNYYRKSLQVWAATDMLTEMLSQIERFRSLSLRNHPSGKAPFYRILSGATGCASNLEELSLIASRCGIESMRDVNFLRGGAPILQRLNIKHVGIPWNRLPLSTTLTHLVLFGGHRPRTNKFYDAFDKLVSLKSLSLSGKLPLGVEGPPTSLPYPITLPSLEYLGVDDWMQELTQFFEVVRLPRVEQAKLTICCDRFEASFGAESVDRCLEAFRSAIEGALPNLQDACTQLCIRQFDGFNEELYGRPGIELQCEPQCCPPWRPYPEPSITIEFGGGLLPPLIELIPSFSKHFDLRAVKTLDVPRSWGFTSDVLLDTFSRLPNLERLYFTAIPVCNIFLAMGEDPACGKNMLDPAPDPAPYFPALFPSSSGT